MHLEMDPTEVLRIIFRDTNHQVYQQAIGAGVDPLLAKILANRCEHWDSRLIATRLSELSHPEKLKDVKKAAKRIADAIEQQQMIGLLTDYDVDGITSHSLMFLSLTQYFSHPAQNVQSFIGHRLRQGYGISEGLCDEILSSKKLPAIIITADCGSSDEKQIKRLSEKEIDVIVTDHHVIPVEGMPISAYAGVNPQQSDCAYEDKTIAGCMVSWLLMCQLRNELIARKHLSNESPKLSQLLDFVALGTVADAVSLQSLNNRAVVLAGLAQMNRMQRPAWQIALKELAKKNNSKSAFEVEDLGFQLGPRINARSRMADPYAALEFLLAIDEQTAIRQWEILDQDNIRRRKTEKQMLEEALEQADELRNEFHYSLAIYSDEFHAGVQGIVASRLVEKYGVPCIVFSQGKDGGQYTASARTVEDVPIRDILQLISDQQADLIDGFGGHKGAAGLRIQGEKFTKFQLIFEQTMQQYALQQRLTLQPTVRVDMSLAEHQLDISTIPLLKQLEPYGRGFDAAVFCNEFILQCYQLVGQFQQHVRMILIYEQSSYTAIWFNALQHDPVFPFNPNDVVRVAYQLRDNFFKQNHNLQLLVRHVEIV